MTPLTADTPRAVLFDRDGTLVVDVPYNADPQRVAAMPTAAAAVRMLRSAHVLIGVVSNQSGIGRGILAREDVDRVNSRIDAALGPFDLWRICPHDVRDGCACRKPRPGMLLDAAAAFGLDPTDVAYIGDIGSDIEAADAAGCRSVLVPTEATRIDEVRRAPHVASDLAGALAILFSGNDADRLSCDREALAGMSADVRSGSSGGGSDQEVSR